MNDGTSRRITAITSINSQNQNQKTNNNKTMNTHTTIAGDTFLPVTIIATPRRNMNRKRPPEPSPLGVWLLILITAIIASLTTYLLTK